MTPRNKPTIEERVVTAAERALAGQQHVSAIDVLVNIGLLAPTAAENWHKGRIAYLEEVIQGSPNKIATALAAFHRWAKDRGLMPSETPYLFQPPAGTPQLPFPPHTAP